MILSLLTSDKSFHLFLALYIPYIIYIYTYQPSEKKLRLAFSDLTLVLMVIYSNPLTHYENWDSLGITSSFYIQLVGPPNAMFLGL